MVQEGEGRDPRVGRYRLAAVLDMPQELMRLLFAVPGAGPALSSMLVGSVGSAAASTAGEPDMVLAQHLSLSWAGSGGGAEERRLLARPELSTALRAHARSPKVIASLLSEASSREDLSALLTNRHVPPRMAARAAAMFLQAGFRPHVDEPHLSFRLSSLLAPQMRQVGSLLGSSARLEQFLVPGPPRRLLLRLLQRPSLPSSAGWVPLLAAERAAFRDWAQPDPGPEPEPGSLLLECGSGGDPRRCVCAGTRRLSPPSRTCACALLSSSELSCSRLGSMPVEDLLLLLSDPRRPATDLDDAARSLWVCLPSLLLEVLSAHERLPDRPLAALSRVSFLPESPGETFPPFSAQQFVGHLGVESAAALLTRLQSLRVRMPPPRPPRYLRTTHGLARRSAGRMLLSEASEVHWLLQTSCGKDVGVDVARTALLLPAAALQDLSYSQSALLLAAASGYSLPRLLSSVTQLQRLDDEPRMLLAAMLLAADLTAAQRRLAGSLVESWTLPPCELPPLLRAL